MNMELVEIDQSKPVLCRYADADQMRNATEAERRASVEAAKSDGGAGVITVRVAGEDVDCYVSD